MKKTIKKAIVLGMVALSGNSMAQTIDSSSVHITDKKAPITYMHPLLNLAATSLNHEKGNKAIGGNEKPVMSLQAGLAFQGGISSHFSMVSEVYYILKGGELGAYNPLTTENGTLRLHAVEAPVLARVHFGKFHVNAGPSVAYNLGGKVKADGRSSKVSFDNSDGLIRFEAGVQVGGGYTFRIKKKLYVLDIRYAHGLTNIAHNDQLYNRNLNISVYNKQPWKKNPLAK
ncbi:porin family protein [uncultured Imperialibacter sp.]|uniref:porin family protein n=1 Tax=uncultured Imperialibacter sp. TaxID=1672639 RepID=UPI0030DC88F0